MSKTKTIIADVSKCYENRLHEAISGIEHLRTQYAIADGDFIVVGRDDQVDQIQQCCGGVKWIRVSGDAKSAYQAAPHVVGEILGGLTTQSAEREFELISYNGHVLRLAALLAAKGVSITARPFKQVVPRWELPEIVPAATLQNDQPRVDVSLESASRSRRFVACLMAQGMGPFTHIRDALYTAVETVLLEHPGMSVRQLVRESVIRARTQLTESGSIDRKFPWRRVEDFLARVLTRSCVLLDGNDKAIPSGFQNAGQLVIKVSDNYRAKADAALVHALILNAKPPVMASVADRAEMAGCLYHSRNASAIDRVDASLDYLIASGRVEVVPGHEEVLKAAPDDFSGE